MTPNIPIQVRKEESRERRRAAERWRKWIEHLRRQQQQERHRRRRWLIALLLAFLETKPVQMFFPVHFAEADPPRQKRQSQRSRKSDEETATPDTRSDDERRYLYDYSPRHGEEELEVYDGLTWNDIVAYNRVHRPWLFPAFTPIPGMPPRYATEQVHVWTLLFEMQYPHIRPDAIAALKLVVDSSAHAWIDACKAEQDGLSYKDLRRQCMRRTPDATLYEFPRAAARWREHQRCEAEERKKEIKETPDNGPRPPGFD